MSAQRIWVFVWTALCVGISLATAQNPPAGPPAAATTQPVVEIDKHIQAINDSQDAMAVAAAYARGVAIDDKNVQLNEAYMRQALKLGYVELAYMPAVFLTRQGSQDALAWGIRAQMQAKDGQYIAAFDAIAKAVALGEDNPFVVSLAAQLLAWHDYAKGPPGIPSELNRQLDGARDQLAKNPAYVTAYDSAKASLARSQSSRSQPLGATVGNANAPAGGRVVELTDEVSRLRRTVEQLRRQECPPTYGAQRGTRQIAQAPSVSFSNYSLYPFGPPAQAAVHPPGLPAQNINPVDPRSAAVPTGGGMGYWIAAPMPFGTSVIVRSSGSGTGE